MLKPSHKSKRKLVKKIKSRSDLSGRNPKSNKNKKWKLERNAYPFASSFQGGLGVANGGYHSVSRGETTCVPVLEQRRQGGQITAQLSGNPSGSLYEVWVANFQGLPNCINAQLCRPQATTRIVTQRQSKRGLEAMIRQTYSLLCQELPQLVCALECGFQTGSATVFEKAPSDRPRSFDIFESAGLSVPGAVKSSGRYERSKQTLLVTGMSGVGLGAIYGGKKLVICVPALTLNAAPQIPESQGATAKLTRFPRSELAPGY
ncbi:uncharacterized protein UMAG_04093 [Mycosarcoma maydis]|uniref:Deoxyribonuclease NucA/NucB domain-containing protein n=1 Tax=Mycosarcoma maydis TaxID=5270 RepID=A0A0D1DWW4_MYCMD|nr:uncharacterized protein UMAG_04093 [Ustilago maydis 521]KIS68051.1 hypothetical protein UMAG_04093 [Ustilago maydis 521]|eukprot:XP_011390525.1 hypothetical protein UMAG_04093 [Ustilago maydis 521]